MDEKAIDLAARKVSAYSGDIRRCLQIAKRAVEICRDSATKSDPIDKKGA
jgi:Cdc6-like AAA superfamily ATPase